jgi:hypothetical protein
MTRGEDEGAMKTLKLVWIAFWQLVILAFWLYVLYQIVVVVGS